MEPGDSYSMLGVTDSIREIGRAMTRSLMRLMCVIGAFFSIALGGTITGRVVSVADGDTITVLTPQKQQVKIRLAGIDAPEAGQEYGQKSKAALAAMVAGKTVNVTGEGTDRYGRTIGWVRAGETDANREMVRLGWAWHFIQYNKDAEIAQLQIEAKQARRGLWAAPNPPMAPWEYRALTRGGTQGSPPINPPPAKPFATSDISETMHEAGPASSEYWINSNGVRHNPRCRWFGNTKRGHYGTKEEGKACGICGG
ncbi:MAG: thermonuclease family protein [Luteolibacter sp.]